MKEISPRELNIDMLTCLLQLLDIRIIISYVPGLACLYQR
jgi:hypothetical protein